MQNEPLQFKAFGDRVKTLYPTQLASLTPRQLRVLGGRLTQMCEQRGPEAISDEEILGQIEMVEYTHPRALEEALKIVSQQQATSPLPN